VKLIISPKLFGIGSGNGNGWEWAYYYGKVTGMGINLSGNGHENDLKVICKGIYHKIYEKWILIANCNINA